MPVMSRKGQVEVRQVGRSGCTLTQELYEGVAGRCMMEKTLRGQRAIGVVTEHAL